MIDTKSTFLLRSLIIGTSILASVNSSLSATVPAEIKQLVKQVAVNQPYGTGFSVAVVNDGKLSFSTGGGNGLDVNGSSRFLLASVTKQLTGAAIAALSNEGKLSFQDPITKFVPEFSNWGALRIRDLLQHRTTLTDYLGTTIYQPNSGPSSDLQILSSLYPFISGMKAGCSKYSNTNYMLLSLIVERASGMPFGEYLEQAIFSPLEMFDTDYKGGPIPSNVEIGHNPRNIPNMLPYYREWASGAGGVVSTANDMAKWLIAVSNGFLNLKTILPRESATGACPGSPLNIYSLGWLMESPSEIFHLGQVWGYASYSRINTKSGKGIIVLSNAESVAGDKIEKFAKTVLSLANNTSSTYPREGGLGSYCCTQVGKFGPHPVQRLPIGNACYWFVPPYGNVPGQVCQ
jgi:D-alanyl-D-alanine carboxypeptidase